MHLQILELINVWWVCTHLHAGTKAAVEWRGGGSGPPTYCCVLHWKEGEEGVRREKIEGGEEDGGSGGGGGWGREEGGISPPTRPS
jgi:hypothetical protein